jgi:hypothetical protein
MFASPDELPPRKKATSKQSIHDDFEKNRNEIIREYISGMKHPDIKSSNNSFIIMACLILMLIHI